MPLSRPKYLHRLSQTIQTSTSAAPLCHQLLQELNHGLTIAHLDQQLLVLTVHGALLGGHPSQEFVRLQVLVASDLMVREPSELSDCIL